MKLIESKKLLKIKNLKHGFFNSVVGKSKNIYKSLNCGPGSKDNSLNIKKNLEIVRKKINNKAKNIFLLHQIHSNKFIYIDEKYKIAFDKAIKNGVKVLCYDCKLNNEEIKLNKQINYEQ